MAHLRFLILFLLCVSGLYAQNTGARLAGVVSDPSGSPIPAAKIQLTGIETGLVRETQSNDAGVYQIINLPVGNYRLEAVKSGMQIARVASLSFDVNQTITLNLAMRLATVADAIDVTAEGTLLESESSQLGAVITREKVTELPLNARNFTQLFLLSPGVTPLSVGQNASGAQSQQVGRITIPAINGQSNRSNHFTLDGVFNDGTYMGTYSVAPNIDGIEQFKIQSHSDQPEFGGTTGGVINLASRAGSNAFHGTLYHFFRNDALDARAFFASRKPALRQNQFGGVVGGPVIKNKTFFFFSYEGFRQLTESNTLTLIPTPAQLGGDFSGSTRNLYDAFTTRPDPASAGRWLRDPIPGNIIPASRLDRSTAAWAKTILPQPINTGFAAFNSRNTDPQSRPADNYSIRADHQFSPSRILWARYTWGEQNSRVAFAIPGTRQIEERPAKNGGLGYTHVVSPTMVFTGLFGYSALSQINSPLLSSRNLFDEGFFKGVQAFEGLTVPGINLPGIFGRITARKSDRGPMEAYQSRGDLSWVRGKHNLKFGAEHIRHPWANTTTDFELGFSTAQTADLNNAGRTGDTIASFVMGVPDDRTYIYPTLVLHSDTFNFYAQDSWKVNSRLTVNYGLRWDMQFQPVMTEGIPATWDFNTGRFLVGSKEPPACGAPPCLPDPNNAYVRQWVSFTGSNRLRSNEYALLGPRLGIAYRITPSWVVRAGFGIFYDTFAGVNQQAQNGGGGGWPVPNSFLNPGSNPNVVQFTADDPFRSAPAAIPAASPANVTAFFFDPKFRNAVSYQWNLDVQKQMPGGIVASAAYVGSANTRLPVGGVYNLAQSPGPGNPRERALWPHAPATDYDRSVGRSKYHSLQTRAERRFAQGFSVVGQYTWSKSIDTGASGFFSAEDLQLQNPYDINSSRSVSGFDIPHFFSVATVYQLPFGKGKRWANTGLASRALGNWQINAILLGRSGQPFTPITNLDIANIGASTPTTRVRPDLLRDPRLANPTPSGWFDRTAYAVPAQYKYGSAGRNQLRSDRLDNVDFSLFREDRWTERFRSQLRVELFNALNHASFGVPQLLITSPSFSEVSGTISNARQMQIALKLLF